MIEKIKTCDMRHNPTQSLWDKIDELVTEINTIKSSLE